MANDPNAKQGGSKTIIVVGVVVVLAILAYITLGGGIDAPEPVDVNTTTLEGDAPDDPVDVPAPGAEN